MSLVLGRLFQGEIRYFHQGNGGQFSLLLVLFFLYGLKFNDEIIFKWLTLAF